MTKPKLAAMLAGGDRRSIGRANEVVVVVLQQPRKFGELVACLSNRDAIVQMRSADALEKISLQRPDWLQKYKAEMLQLMEQIQQQELRWHLALMIPRLKLTNGEQRRAVTSLREFLNDRSSIVKTCALQALCDLARANASLWPDVERLLEEALRTGTAAMKARARKLLSQKT